PVCEAHQRSAESNILSPKQISRADAARTCFAALSQRRSALMAAFCSHGAAGRPLVPALFEPAPRRWLQASANLVAAACGRAGEAAARAPLRFARALRA